LNDRVEERASEKTEPVLERGGKETNPVRCSVGELNMPGR